MDDRQQKQEASRPPKSPAPPAFCFTVIVYPLIYSTVRHDNKVNDVHKSAIFKLNQAGV